MSDVDGTLVPGAGCGGTQVHTRAGASGVTAAFRGGLRFSTSESFDVEH